MRYFKSVILSLFLIFSFNICLFAYSNLKEAVNDTTAIKEYSLTNNETVTTNIGNLGGTQLTIFGNGYDIVANNNIYGIGVGEGQTLNIEGVNNITKFYNSNNWGGAIMNHGDGITNIGNNIKFSSNSSFYGGGAIHNMKILNVGSNVIFSSNTSNKSGGAINNSGDYGGATTVGENVLFEYNKSNSEGGAIINTDDGNVSIDDNANFVSNTATGYAGAIWNQNIMLIGNNANYISNEAIEWGGAIVNCKGTLTLKDNNSFILNNADRGGAISNLAIQGYSGDGIINIGKDVTFTSNTATKGGAIYNFGEEIINPNEQQFYTKAGIINISSNSAFSYNTAIQNGGAIYNGGNINIGSNSQFEHNKTNVYGGGAIFNEGQLTIGSNVVFSSNTTTDGGGAIDNENGGTTIVGENALFEYNKSSVIGGAIRNTSDNDDFVSIGNNSKFVSNGADVAGGAIWNSKEMEIKDGATYYSNTSNQFGGAIVNCEGTLTLKENNSFNLNNSQKGGAIANLGLQGESEDGIINIGKDVTFTSNTATDGGAIYNFGEEYITLYGQQYQTKTGTINISSNSTFSYNTATQYGGAICNNGTLNIKDTGYYYNNSAQVGGALLNFEDGVMDIGYNSYFEKNRTTTGEGGAIENCGTLTISSGTKFVLNEANTNGGAISNAMYINSDFVANVNIGNNVTFSSNSAKYGGALSNISATAIIGNNNVFEYNTSVNDGGAIYNTKNDYKDIVGSITINSNNYFYKNSAKYGGAIFNKGILNIGNDNIFSSNTATKYGGAIVNMKDNSTSTISTINIGNNAKFINNIAQTDCGGAITNTGRVTIGDNAIFEQNSSAGSGGAIYNNATGNITIGKNVNFSNNTEQYNGGAIHNEGILTLLDGGIFNNNIAYGGSGGAINLYNNGTINLIANTKNIEFSGNKEANGISNAIHSNGGTINLWASENADIIFNDRITSYDSSSVLNINKSSGTLPITGKIILNEDMSGYTDNVNLYAGEVELQSKTNCIDNINTNKFFSGDINFSSGTLNILNDSIDNIIVENWTSTANSNLKFDTDLSNNTSDNFTVTNSASGELNLTAINILGVNGTSGQITLFKNSKSPTLNILTTANYGGYEYTFTNSGTSGVLNYLLTGYKTLKESVNATSPVTRSYSLSEKETVTADLGALGGEQLTIFGNGYEVDGNSKAGIMVSNGQTLNIAKGTSENFVWKNFHTDEHGNGGVLSNSGIINVDSNIKFKSNTAMNVGGVIDNSKNGTIIIKANVIFDTNCGWGGGGAIYNNENIVIDDNVLFSSNIADGSYGGAIINHGNLNIGLNSKFIGNHAAWGGAIDNSSILLIEDSASFITNESTGVNLGGGAILNRGGELILNNEVKFYSNISKSNGGAIYNAGKLKIKGNANFTSNEAYKGGAICNSGGIITIGSDSTFKENSGQYGGAIYNQDNGEINISSNVKFVSNLAVYGGGAIYNYNGNFVFDDVISFSSNTARHGGAIDNRAGEITFLNGAIFNNNKVLGSDESSTVGGAIFNLMQGKINLIANTNDIEFTGNTADGVSNAIYDYGGTINLWASDDASIIFNDRIKSYDNTSVLNINQSSGTLPTTGKIILNEDMSGYFGQVNLYDGEIELQAKTSGSNINTNKFFSGNINLSGGTLNILNNVIDNITVSTWTSTSNTNLKFDTDLSNNTSDNFTITKSVGGELNLTAINILGVDENSGQITLFNNTKSPTLNILTTGNYGGDEYIFTNNDVAGVLNYQKSGVTKTFKEVINETEPAIRSYSLANDEIVTANLGQLGGTQLTIFGNGYKVDGNSKAGITVSNGQTLNIEKGTGEDFVWEKFKKTGNGGVLYNNNGTIIIGSAMFSTNKSQNSSNGSVSCSVFGGSIYNKGTITISSTTFNFNETYTENISQKEQYSSIDSSSYGYGGAIYNNKLLTISSSTFNSNIAKGSGGKSYGYGGAIYNSSGTLTISSTTFSSNKSSGSGGYYYSSYVSGYRNGYGYGGAICNSSGTIVTVNSAIFSSNKSSGSGGNGYGYGGAIYNNSGILNISSTTFSSNESNGSGNSTSYSGGTSYGSGYGYGGAIYNSSEQLTINSATFSFNKAKDSGSRGFGYGYGGAIYNSSGTLTISSTTFSSNESNGSGGISYSGPSYTDYGSGYGYGGAIYTSGAVIIDSTKFVLNKAYGSNSSEAKKGYGYGGAIYNNSGVITISSTVCDSNSSSDGGAIYNKTGGIITIDSTAFESNSATGYGGAICNIRGTITIDSTTFKSNSASNSGGAIENLGGTITISSTTFESNSATSYGGAIYTVNADSKITFMNGIKFINDSAQTQGGAIYNRLGIINLIANTNNVEFTGNTANGVSNAIHDYNGTINLWASENADIIFNDRITSEDNTSILNINSSTTTLTANGKVVLNEDMSGYTGIINLYNGNLEIIEGNNFVGGNFTIYGGTFTANANSIITDFTNNGTVNLTGGTIANNISGLTDGVINIKNNDVTINDDVFVNNNNIKLGTTLKLLNEESLNASILTICNGAILNTQNNSTGTINANSIVIADGANWTYQLDVDLKSAKADNLINVDYVGNGSKATIDDIHLLSDKATKTSIQIADNDIKATIAQYNFKIYTTNLSYGVTTSLDSNSNTLLNIEAIGYGGLANAIYDGASSYSVTEDIDYLTKWIEDPIGTINNQLKGNLTISNISSNKRVLKSTNNVEGLITEGYTLQINNVNLEGFNEAIKVNNANGNLQLTNVKFSSNTGNAVITSSGTVELSGVVFDNTNTATIDVINDNKLILSFSSTTFTTGVIGKGTTTIKGVDINLANAVIEQNKIEIKDNGSLAANANNIVADIENNSNLIFTQGTNNNWILGTGTTIIDGSVINSSTIVNAVTINENKQLTTLATNIDGRIENNGNLIFTGGTNNNVIVGTGLTQIYDNVINQANITQEELEILANKQITNETSTITINELLTINENAKIINDGKLVISSGTNNGRIEQTTNTSTTTITGTFINNGNMEQTIFKVEENGKVTNNNVIVATEITNNGNTETSATNIIGNIVNNGILLFNSGEINNNRIIGIGTLNITTNSFINNNLIEQKTIEVSQEKGEELEDFVNNSVITTENLNLKSINFILTKNGILSAQNLSVQNSEMNLANSILQEHNFKTITVSDNLNLSVDADLANKQMDTIYASSFTGEGKISIKAINILSDAKENKTEVLFTSSTVLKNKITSIDNASSKLFKYDVNYDKNTGNLNFLLTAKNNPVIAESFVASATDGLITQTTILNQAFSSIDSIRSRITQAKQKGMLYASTADMLFDTPNRIESGLWIRPFMSQDTISFDSFDVDSTLTGTLAGIDLVAGENSLVSFYLGYAGSNQKYEDIKINQTGYVVGATGMLIKEKWYAGLTANINFNKAESESDYGTDSFDMNMYSVGAKAGYNFDLSEKFVLEPNLTLMYGNVSNQEYETTQKAKIDSQSVANITVEPQVKAKLNLANGWQPYGLLGYLANMGDKGKVVAAETEFEMDKIDGYVEYGLGVNKDFVNTPWNCYLQVTGRSGGINGFSGNIGIKYSFGNKSEIKEQKKKEKEEKARLEAEEKARIAEEKRIAKEEQAKQKALEEERIRKEKEEKAKLELEEKARIAEQKKLEMEKTRLEIEKTKLEMEMTKQKKLEEEKIRIEKERKEKEEQAKQKALEEERIRKEKEEKAKLEAEEKARIAEENRIKKEEQEKQIELEKERMRKEKEEQAKQKALEEKQKKIEMEARARLEAEEKARLAEEKRIAKEEYEKQIELEKERIRKEKEEMKRQKQLEIERKIQENYN